jgi:hypothetical protein
VFAGVAVLLIVWCGRAGAGPEGKLVLPDAARKAEQLYAKQLKDLRAEYEAKVREAFRAHVERLTTIQGEYTAAEDVEGALAVRTRVKELRQNPPETAEEKKRAAKAGLPIDALRGTWMTTATDGGRTERHFHGRNQVRTNGKESGHLYRRNGDLIIEHHFGKLTVIERINLLADGRLFLENFNPGNTYPKGKPLHLNTFTKLD